MAMKYGIKVDAGNNNAFQTMGQFPDGVVPNDFIEINEAQFNLNFSQFMAAKFHLKLVGANLVEDTDRMADQQAIRDQRAADLLDKQIVDTQSKILAYTALGRSTTALESLLSDLEAAAAS